MRHNAALPDFIAGWRSFLDARLTGQSLPIIRLSGWADTTEFRKHLREAIANTVEESTSVVFG